jgi:hypothetical protein
VPGWIIPDRAFFCRSDRQYLAKCPEIHCVAAELSMLSWRMLTSSDQCSPLPQNRIGSRRITKDEKSLSTGQQFQLCASKSSGVHCWRNKIFCRQDRRNMAVVNFSAIRIYTPQRYLHANDEQIKNTVEKNGEVTRNRTKTGQWKN